MNHWAEEYIGQPWIPGDSDCWAFFRQVQRKHFGRMVPAIDVDALNRLACVRTFDEHPERGMWSGVENPQDGDAVLMARGRHPSHVGVWVNGGVLHSQQGAGVVFSKLPQLARDGWSTITFFRHL